MTFELVMVIAMLKIDWKQIIGTREETGRSIRKPTMAAWIPVGASLGDGAKKTEMNGGLVTFV